MRIRFGQHWYFAEGTPVIIHSLDDSGTEWSGHVRGVAIRHLIDTYIIELAPGHGMSTSFSCVPIPESNLRPAQDTYTTQLP